MEEGHHASNLKKQLLSMFIARYIILAGAFNDVFKPWLTLKVKVLRRSWMGEPPSSFTALQADMLEYGNRDLTDDWLDVLLAVGWTMFFGSIAPVLVFFLLVVIAFQIRCDAWKLLNVYRRPYPRIVKNIGSFDTLLVAFGYCMIITNVGLLRIQLGSRVKITSAMGMDGLNISRDWFGRLELLLEALTCVIVIAFLSLLWASSGLLMPNETYFLRLEERRQDLQRRKLWSKHISSRKQLEIRHLDHSSTMGKTQFFVGSPTNTPVRSRTSNFSSEKAKD